MRLQQLYIKGFKSFATETVINFNERVTGIVGPNGSGKSNIVDAIRWVLGEQKSRELRLERMGDVLFNGTKKRKPSPVARVNLTFSNDAGVLPTEYSTVNIARVLYRSGESEYLLNDVPCRLKDIQTLFMDTGIGSDSYAIIALGMVDDILADKENARSKMFEQAAGISKYKKRKRETLLKLKNTEADLNRVEDLLFEIEENLKSLERQARRTKRYFDIKANYREQAIKISIAKSADFKSRYDILKKAISTSEDGIRSIEVKRVAEEARLEKERNALLEKESHLSGLQKALNQLLSDLRQVENDLQIKKQQLQFTGQNIKQVQQQLEDNENRVASVKKELGTLEKDLDAAVSELTQKESELQKTEEEFKKLQEQQSQARNSLNELAAKRSEIETNYQEIEKKMAVNANRKERIAEDISRINERRSAIHEKNKTNADQIKQLKGDLGENEKELRDLERLSLERKKKLDQLDQDIEKWQERLNEAHRKWDARKNERDLLKSMVDKLEGFPESIKFLSKQWKTPAPILSDLLYCQENYRPAVEWILEPFLNHYVVRDYKEALEAISLLSKSQKGKANFILLDQIPRTETKLAVVPDAVHALDIIEADSTYKPLFHYLLNDVYLVNDEKWSELMEGEYPSLTLVSESGTYMRKGHMVSGGSVGLFEGKKLGRKKNLEKLEAELNDLGKKKQKIDEELIALKRDQRLLKDEDIDSRINKARQKTADINRTLVQWETQQKGAHDELDLLDQREKELELQLKEIQGHDEEIARQLNEAALQRQSIEKDVEKAGGAFGSTDALVANKREELNQIRIGHIQTQNKKEQLVREVKFRSNAIEDLSSRILTGKDNLVKYEKEKESCQKDIRELESRLADLHEKRKNESANLQEVETRFFAERNTIQEIEKGIRILNREFQDAQTRLNDQKDQFNEVRLQVHSISERIEAEFNQSLEDAIKEFGTQEFDDLEAEEEKLARVKVRLQNFGEINPMAVEAYEAMKERFDMISGQREDILEAKDSLHQTISEIEAKATEQFLEAFHKVRDHFRQVFRELFTQDDDCDLILLNEEDPLESGIEIIAKPKGKRPKSLSQLSGGEKTLTATALLFALYLLKPAPFCIFDEVDAPLDDANIQKFNRIIKKFSEDSQFIIITHNKLTMAAVDIIYGVYMEETGVSNVSAVDFRHLEHQEMIAN